MTKFSLILATLCLFLSFSALAADKFGDLNKADQKYYKNDYGEGNNQRERIDKDVREINSLHAQIKGLKAEINELREEVEKLKKTK